MTSRKPPASRRGQRHEASFRDPAGFVFKDARGRVLRQINQAGASDFELLHSSGLYDELVNDGLLVSHKRFKAQEAGAHAIIQPEQVAYVSYPFEWSFSQLKDAALLTLDIQQRALKRGLRLKDASAYNVQFVNGRAVFIDTLSFEAYVADQPWKAYMQFCQHFLAPLALMAYTDFRLSQLLRVHLDGVPLDLAASLLPRRARFRAGLMMHLFLHARAQKAKARDHRRQAAKVGLAQQLAILTSLERTVKKLQPLVASTEWGDYYDNTNYSSVASDHKSKLISQMVRPLKLRTALDIGGNNGHYSRVLNRSGILTVCSDIDPNAVEANYRQVKHAKEQLMLPMVVDFTNPGGALGWRNRERMTVEERLKVDMVMALAVVHHLAISNNLPFSQIAEGLSRLAPHLLIEFVPKADSQVQKLLANRADIFPDYHESAFKDAFSQYYRLLETRRIRGTKRSLYLFKRRGA